MENGNGDDHNVVEQPHTESKQIRPSLIMSDGDSYDEILLNIAHYVYRYEITSPLAYKRARHALLDALGCAAESLHVAPDCAAMMGPVVPGTVVPNGFKLPGTTFQLDPVKGAFDLGAMIRYLDHNDAYPGAEWGHPSDNLGALVAVTDWLSRSRCDNHDTTNAAFPGPPTTIHTLLTAQIKAYEIQGQLQALNAFNAVGLDHTILVKVASTALVCWLLGLTISQCLAALSQAWQDGHPLRTFRQAPNTGPRKGWAAGDACMRAVHLALLTRAGQPGASKVLTAKRWGFYDALFQGKEFCLRAPYTSFVMETVFFKIIPAEGHGISAVEAALTLVKELKGKNLRADTDIARVRIRTQGPAFTIINKTGLLRNAADRDHCLQFIVAVVLLKESCISTSDYRDESPWAKDPRVDVLREKVEIVEDQQFTADYKDQRKRSCSNGISIVLNDGRDLDEVVVEWPVGHPGREDTLERVKTKFRRNMTLGYASDDGNVVVKEDPSLNSLDAEKVGSLEGVSVGHREKKVQEMLKLVNGEMDQWEVSRFIDLFWKTGD